MGEDLESSVESLSNPRKTERRSRPDLDGKDFEGIDWNKVDVYRKKLDGEAPFCGVENTQITPEIVEVHKDSFARGDMSYLFSAKICGQWFACKKSWISVEDNRARYEKELENLQALHKSLHWHVVQLMGSYVCEREGLAKGQLLAEGHMILSPLAECTLEHYLSQTPTQGRKLVVKKWFGCLASGLKSIHQQKMKHKDIKTENILVHGDNIIITDLGISNPFTERSTSYGGSPGTFVYWAPELHAQSKRGRQQDVWSMMCCFIEMISFVLGFSILEFRGSCNPARWKFNFNEDYDNIIVWLRKLEVKTTDQELRAFFHLLLKGFKKEAKERPSANELFDRLRHMGSLVGACCASPRDPFESRPRELSLLLSTDLAQLQQDSVSHFVVDAGRRIMSRMKSPPVCASLDELLEKTWEKGEKQFHIREKRLRSIRSVEKALMLYIALRQCSSAQEYLSFCNAFIEELSAAVRSNQYRTVLYDVELGEEEKPYTTAYFAILVEVILSRCRTNRWIGHQQDPGLMSACSVGPDTALAHRPGEGTSPGNEKSSGKGMGRKRANKSDKGKAPEKGKAS